MARKRKPKGVNAAARSAAGTAAEVVAVVRLGQRTPSDLVACTFGGKKTVIPAKALDQFATVLTAMAAGTEVAIVPADISIGTEELGRVLGVSRRWASELIDRGELEGTKVGSKRRVTLASLAAYSGGDQKLRE